MAGVGSCLVRTGIPVVAHVGFTPQSGMPWVVSVCRAAAMRLSVFVRMRWRC